LDDGLYRGLACVPTANRKWQKPGVVACLEVGTGQKFPNLVRALEGGENYLEREWRADKQLMVRLREVGVRKVLTTTEISNVATSLGSAGIAKSGIASTTATANELSHYVAKHKKTDAHTLSDIAWVPLATRPTDFNFCGWKNDELLHGNEKRSSESAADPNVNASSDANTNGPNSMAANSAFVRPSDAAAYQQRFLIGSVVNIADGKFNQGLLVKKITQEDVRMQLIEIIKACESSVQSATGVNINGNAVQLEAALDHIYKYLDADAVAKMSGRKWVWTGADCGFASSSHVTKHDAAKSLAPWLHHLPPKWNVDDVSVFSAINTDLSDSEGCEMVISALKRIGDKQEEDEKRTKTNNSKGEPTNLDIAVPDEERRAIVALVNLLAGGVDNSNSNLDGVLLPKTGCRLAPASNVLINDMPWLREDDPQQLEKFRANLLHEDISASNAEKLCGTLLTKRTAGAFVRRPVPPVDSAGNRRLSFVKALGQGEKLTTRLQNILKDYDGTAVVKEMIQNANDSELSDEGLVEIVMDWRQHKTEKMMSHEFKETQGPRFCVVNCGHWQDKDWKGMSPY
jgi:hypothetical protein